MTYGLVDRGNHKYYTYMSKVFEAINNAQNNYNWLIADCMCYPQNREIDDLLNQDYCWISGEELTSLVEKEDFQWIWGVLCGFEKDISLEEVLKYPLPYIQNENLYGNNPVSVQHPLSTLEIAAVDSAYTLLITKNKEHYDDYIKRCPQVEDLEKFNIRF